MIREVDTKMTNSSLREINHKRIFDLLYSLIEKGIIDANIRGQVRIVLPRFSEYAATQIEIEGI